MAAPPWCRQGPTRAAGWSRAASRYQPRALFRTYLYAIGFRILRAHRRKAAFRATFLRRRNNLPEPAKQDANEANKKLDQAKKELDKALDKLQAKEATDQAALDPINLIAIRGQPRNQAVHPVAPGREPANRLHQHRGCTGETRSELKKLT